MPHLIPAWLGGSLIPVEPHDAHRRGLRHRAVSVFILRGQDVLIQRRALSRQHLPGLWSNSGCGHPAWQEQPEDCAIRRLRAELGITGIYPNHRGQIEYRTRLGADLIEHELVDLFVAYAPPELPLAPDPREVAELRWLGIHDLAAEVARHPDQFTPWLRACLPEHTGSILGALQN
ncbi:isopentenyl-diphosphate Delta-isomerase [Plastorhodobacter daqingensis]|uniref:Isopentenyl-diphosphate Delta-isomerase n=1 Tax=Plastorhodobacter daqingensis TaxID=1387281 RepID=A0ABW2UPG8_9RHOB